MWGMPIASPTSAPFLNLIHFKFLIEFIKNSLLEDYWIQDTFYLLRFLNRETIDRGIVVHNGWYIYIYTVINLGRYIETDNSNRIHPDSSFYQLAEQYQLATAVPIILSPPSRDSISHFHLRSHRLRRHHARCLWPRHILVPSRLPSKTTNSNRVVAHLQESFPRNMVPTVCARRALFLPDAGRPSTM